MYIKYLILIKNEKYFLAKIDCLEKNKDYGDVFTARLVETYCDELSDDDWVKKYGDGKEAFYPYRENVADNEQGIIRMLYL